MQIRIQHADGREECVTLDASQTLRFGSRRSADVVLQGAGSSRSTLAFSGITRRSPPSRRSWPGKFASMAAASEEPCCGMAIASRWERPC